MIGQTVSHYKIVSRLGAGGMGEVLLAEDTKLDRRVALKFLPESLWNDPEARQRLLLEAKAASKLDHPSIVTIHGIEESDGRPFIVMAHVNGAPLDKYIAIRSLSVEEVINLTMQITDGLQHAHDAGVVHRDLKPGNILVDDKGRVRILDFGLARMRGTSRLTQVGSTVGTLSYSPPELIQGDDAAPTSDIYSLGVVLYQMLTGHLPFESDHEAALLYSILQDDPRPLTYYDPTIPTNLQAVVSRCLEKRPENRIPNCSELSNALGACRSEHPSMGVNSRGKNLQLADRPSIAVMPFVNRSADVGDEYFSDGLADELLNVLAKIRGLRVAARTSSFHFKGKDTTIAEIGRALNVATVLEGSVRKAGTRVRISVQLVKVADGYHLWSETYDRMLVDIFAVQDDIAQSVVTELRKTLLGEKANSRAGGEVKAEVSKAARGRGTNIEAHRLYLQGRYLVERYNLADTAKAIEYLKQALDLDPEFAHAWAELGFAYSRQADSSWAPVADAYGRAREAVERALALEPNLAEGHAHLAWIQMLYDWDWRGAETSFRRALELAPGNATVLRRAGVLAFRRGRLEEGIGLYRSALEQDPLSAHSYSNLGIALHETNRYMEAEGAFRKSLELVPQKTGVRSMLALTLLAQGRNEEALAEVMREPDEGSRLWALAITHHVLGNRAESDDILQELIEKYSDDTAYSIAGIHGVRGEEDAAFTWLERARAQRDGGLTNLKTDSQFRSLHADPRWGVLLKKMGLGD